MIEKSPTWVSRNDRLRLHSVNRTPEAVERDEEALVSAPVFVYEFESKESQHLSNIGYYRNILDYPSQRVPPLAYFQGYCWCHVRVERNDWLS